ncbi:DUF21 and CBS domain containing protein [Pseudohyphozyma bogoriensis]|nr:DUF21 and CBS domain containing protein [Pseudohyphozyma bogoriensis]
MSHPRLFSSSSPRYSIAKLLVLVAAALPHVLKASPVALSSRLVESGAVGVLETMKNNAKEHHPPVGSEEYFYKLAFSAFLVIIGGVFSGLTLGLMGLDMVNLRGPLPSLYPAHHLPTNNSLPSAQPVLSTSGSEQEKSDALKVLKLLERGRHWVLVCLLLSNVIVNESLPIFLDSILGGGAYAVVLSTALIVIFGEIIPQALCARYGLTIGAKCTPFVLALMYAEFPVAWPIAKLLDHMLGEDHGTVYKKAELKTFVGLHGHIGEEMLNEDEVTIISAVLELSDKPVSAIMTPIEDVYVMPEDTVLNQEKIDEILALGHSRIPVHSKADKKSFMGMLIVKKLISYDPAKNDIVSSFPLTVLPETGPDSTCLDALNYFQQGRSHILLVSTTPGLDGGAIGVVTLEDVIEEMIGEEIIDESDVYVDVHNKIKVVRGPQKPQVASGKALAPLIQGVIERRRVHRKRTTADYGSMTVVSNYEGQEPGSEVPPTPAAGVNTAAKAFAKVKVKGGGPAERRSDLVKKGGDGTATATASPRMLEEGSLTDEPMEQGETETAPLLGGRGKP